MRNGDVQQFIAIVESEALQLHSMMMTSLPYYVLMRPNTLAIIEKIWQFRESSGLPLCFTLDAGANVHLLYDGKIDETLMNFVNNTLLSYCKNGQYLCSTTGKRPVAIV
jgi:diphosphomevalonate decarboxylase